MNSGKCNASVDTAFACTGWAVDEVHSGDQVTKDGIARCGLGRNGEIAPIGCVSYLYQKSVYNTEDSEGVILYSSQ